MEINPAEFRILIVDDSSENIDYVGNILKGFKKSVAMTGKKAMEKVMSDKFDLVLLDVMLPDIDGYEVCRMIKNEYSLKELPVVFLTSKTEAEDEEKGYNSGADDYIIKPFYPRGLFERIKNQLIIRKLKLNQKE